MQRIVPLAGNPCSGKSSLAKHLVDNYGFSLARPSDYIREFASENNIALNERRDYIRTHLQMLAVRGEDFIVDTVLASSSQRICIDGERIPSQIEKYREHGAIVLALWCPIDIRHARATTRLEQRDKVSFKDFAADEAREYQSNEPPYASVMTVMQTADYHIDSSLPFPDVTAKVDKIVESFLAA